MCFLTNLRDLYIVSSMKSLIPTVLVALTLPLQAQISFTPGATRQTRDFHSGVAVMVTDVNGDGRDDIVRLHNANRVTVTLQGQEDRILNTYYFQISGSAQWNITGGDIDNDGWFDIITSGSYNRVKVLRGIPFSNTFNPSLINDQTFFAQASNVVDIDNDGFLDLFICNDDEKSVIFMNDQAGNLIRNDTIIDFTTTPPSDNSGNYGSVWTDIDSDGDLDLYIAKCRQGVNNPADPRRINALYLNDGNNVYTEMADTFHLAIGAQSWTADFGDIDNDGDFDLFITNHDVAGQLLENVDNTYFKDITANSGIVVLGVAMQGTFRDFDNDGLLDLIVSGSNDYLYHNIGGKQFEPVPDLFADRPVTSFGIGDLNSDGFLDVYASYTELFNDPSPILDDILWFNTGNDNHYVSVTLAGTHCNASAVGSRLYLYGDWGMQTREVHAGEGYGITNSLSQHFGVGAATVADSLVVIWPCGMKEVFSDVVTNVAYYLEEGMCLTQLMHLDAGPFTQCLVEQFDISAPDGFASYLWNTGDTTQELKIFQPGTYHVSMTDDSGCTWIAGPVSVSRGADIEPGSIAIDVEGRVAACSGDEITLSGPSDGLSYLWNTGDTTASISPVVSGAYFLKVDYTCSTLYTDTVDILLLDPNDLTLVNDTIVESGFGELLAPGDSIQWFADSMGLDPVGSGQVFVTPLIDTTTTYYAQQTQIIHGEQSTTGEMEHNGVTLYNSNTANGAMRFDVFNRFRLDSVTVFTDFPGDRTILIIDVTSDTMYRQTFGIDSGRTVLPLDVWIEPGLDYLMTTDRDTNQLTFGFNSPRLYRSDRELKYPYTVPGVLSITGTQSSQQFYYYFYDWHLSREDQVCVGDLIPVQVVVIDTTSGAFTPHVEPLDLKPNPAEEYIAVGNTQFLGQASSVTICDARGVQVGGWTRDDVGGKLHIGNLPEGMYFIRILHDEKTYVGQFVKM